MGPDAALARSALMTPRTLSKDRRTSGQGQTIGVRLEPDQIADIDAWIATRAHKITRPEAIRELALRKARIDLDGGD